ncbi:MAG: hypothetical protein Q8K65_12625 [Alphaproteobacteria bacterium]|nr:hypothetical protein [Alphaproteobacteria bacterium]
MAGKYKAEYEFYPAEDKYEGDCHRYTGSDHGGLSGSDMTSVDLRQDPYQRQKYSATFSFSTGADKRALRQENVIGLLEGNAGVTDAKVNSHGNASGFSVTVEGIGQKDLMRLAVALTHEAPKGPRGDAFHYPVLDADVAGQIIGAELDRLKISPVEAGLVSITTDTMTQERAKLYGLEKPVSYVDADFAGYPTSPVISLKENGVFAQLEGKAAMQVETRLDLRSGAAPKVLDALQSAGLRAERSKDGQYITVSAPADSVADAFKSKGLIAPAVGDAIKSAAEAAHPGQQKINMQIDAASPLQAKVSAAVPAKLSV